MWGRTTIPSPRPPPQFFPRIDKTCWLPIIHGNVCECILSVHMCVCEHVSVHVCTCVCVRACVFMSAEFPLVCVSGLGLWRQVTQGQRDETWGEFVP